jgi:hypothetical protein
MGLKDAVWILVYVISLATVWNAFKNKINNLETNMILMKKVVYQESGVLNLIDANTCKEHRAVFKKDITKVENASALLSEKMDNIGDNVLIIITKLEMIEDDRRKLNG